MPYHEFFWTDVAVEKVERNGLSLSEVEQAVIGANAAETSRSSGRKLYRGEIDPGDIIIVVFEEIDELTIRVVTAFRIYER